VHHLPRGDGGADDEEAALQPHLPQDLPQIMVSAPAGLHFNL
jgi:hypothetical protein